MNRNHRPRIHTKGRHTEVRGSFSRLTALKNPGIANGAAASRRVGPASWITSIIRRRQLAFAAETSAVTQGRRVSHCKTLGGTRPCSARTMRLIRRFHPPGPNASTKLSNSWSANRREPWETAPRSNLSNAPIRSKIQVSSERLELRGPKPACLPRPFAAWGGTGPVERASAKRGGLTYTPSSSILVGRRPGRSAIRARW